MIVTQKNQETLASTLAKAKSPQRMDNYQEKLQTALELNSKLKDLMQTMRNNAFSRKSEACKSEQSGSEGQQLLKLRKKEGILTSQVQHLTNNLNVLISQNAKLKSQVDGSRNSRVIYSNVYKNIEKEIRKNQYMYKQMIIDGLCYEEVQKRMEDRLNKATKKIQRDIGELQGGIKPLRKKDKRKSRLDTGLSSYRQDSKDTNRASNDPTARQDHIRNTSNQQLITRQNITHRTNQQGASNSLTNSLANSMAHKEEKPMRSRVRLPSEKIDDYYELEMKSNYYDNLVKHLKEITGFGELRDIAEDWENIDSRLEEEYCGYLELEKEAKRLREEREELEWQFQLKSEKQLAEKTVEEEELTLIESELQKEREGLAKLQEKLTEIIDINSSRLNDEEITQHIQRIKRRGDNSSSRQLEKLLQTVSKQKGHQATTASRVSNKSRI